VRGKKNEVGGGGPVCRRRRRGGQPVCFVDKDLSKALDVMCWVQRLGVTGLAMRKRVRAVVCVCCGA
jgi:hypothetical protein